MHAFLNIAVNLQLYCIIAYQVCHPFGDGVGGASFLCYDNSSTLGLKKITADVFYIIAFYDRMMSKDNQTVIEQRETQCLLHILILKKLYQVNCYRLCNRVIFVKGVYLRMTSKERLNLVLSGKIPDRVPISTYELCGFNSKSFENNQPSYKQMMDYIREHTDCVTMYDPWSKASDGGAAMEQIRTVDRYSENGYHVIKTTLKTPARTLTQTSKYSDDVVTTWNIEHLCKDIDDVDALMSLPFSPDVYDFSDYQRIIGELGENGIVMSTVGDPACYAMEIMEFGEATVWALSEPEHFKATLDEIHRRQMINLKNMLDTQTVDLYRICGAEYITPPYLSPKHFEMYAYPYLCEMTELIHRYGAKVRIHSHGNIGKVLDMIIDTGADAIDPCEAPPDGDITLSEVKKQINGRMTIFGNLQLKLLEHSTPQQVREAVKLCMDSAKEGGGYIIMPTASPINLPLSKITEENYKVFIDTAIEYGRY